MEGPASFSAQAEALLRKNLTFQKRNLKTNIRLVAYPILFCVLLVMIQSMIDNEADKPSNRCGCTCINTKSDGSCEKSVCGIQYSTLDQASTCSIPSPPEWPALLQVPRNEYRASRTDSCIATQSCAATILYTGANRTLAERLAGNLFTMASPSNISNYLDVLSNLLPGTDTDTREEEFIEPAFLSDRPLYIIQPQCAANFSSSIPIQMASKIFQQEVKCIQGLNLWRNSSSVVNDEMFKGYQQGNTRRNINEIVTAYDFLNTNKNKLNMIVWYNSTYNIDSRISGMTLVRVPRSLNMVSNAYLQFLKGGNVKMQLLFVKEMPKTGKKMVFDLASLGGTLFFKLVIELLFPVCAEAITKNHPLKYTYSSMLYNFIYKKQKLVLLTYLVYEKQEKLKIMMKMHGLGDGPYWIISYAYFFSISVVYIFLFVVFGSVTGLRFFRLNDYSIQLVFYFIYINLQIALAFLAATAFSHVKTAQVLSYMYMFGSGLLAGYLFQNFVEDLSFPRHWLLIMEIFPAFSLYRGLYEFSVFAFTGSQMGTSGMRWSDLNNSENGMREVLIIMSIEWIILLPLAYYLDQLTSFGGAIQGDPLSFLHCFRKKPSASSRNPSLQKRGSNVSVDMEKPDVLQERYIVEQLLLEPSTRHAIICDNLRKVYPGEDGNPDKIAVQGLSLALPRGECFGMLGPNGAGKTTFISMMIGLTKPTSGSAYVHGLDLLSDMDKIYTNMGVCPQHDMLWEMLTGREHLLFYGRLKNLKGDALQQAVEESLKSVNLYYGGVGDKQARKYSGGMKRRLSVAISLIGDPKVVYMDEPSTGLDPASRNNLWNVMRRAKQDRAIILTTHSMEEAEVLCDRLGIFVDGSLQCIGSPAELKCRYGGSYVFTMTTSADDEHEVENLVRQLSPNANKIYHISGTQKFEFPKHDVRIADVFRAVENGKKKFTIQAWGLANTTLEDVFIKVATGAQSSNM